MSWYPNSRREHSSTQGHKLNNETNTVRSLRAFSAFQKMLPGPGEPETPCSAPTVCSVVIGARSGALVSPVPQSLSVSICGFQNSVSLLGACYFQVLSKIFRHNSLLLFLYMCWYFSIFLHLLTRRDFDAERLFTAARVCAFCAFAGMTFCRSLSKNFCTVSEFGIYNVTAYRYSASLCH